MAVTRSKPSVLVVLTYALTGSAALAILDAVSGLHYGQVLGVGWLVLQLFSSLILIAGGLMLALQKPETKHKLMGLAFGLGGLSWILYFCLKSGGDS